MTPWSRCVLALGLLALVAHPVVQGQDTPPPNPDTFYRLGPDSMGHDGVPKGEVRGPYTLPSEAYPGTQHTYWVYVPAQYDPGVPASLMVFNDGQAYLNMDGDLRAPNVLDNLIHRREIPVKDPERHGIGGASSGAIAAFTVAWERPDHFRKVLSMIGSFTNIRGGHQYAEIVRASPKKPLRIYLQDGRNDNRGVGRGGTYDETRDWFLQNVRLMQALTEKGYDLNYQWGIGGHNQKHAGAVFPDMMRWLWRDHPVSTDPDDTVERTLNR
jgi:enterochelin esterase-like enzyme